MKVFQHTCTLLTTSGGCGTAELGFPSSTLTLVIGTDFTSTFVLIEGTAWDLTSTIDDFFSEDFFSTGNTVLLGLMSTFSLVSIGLVSMMLFEMMSFCGFAATIKK